MRRLDIDFHAHTYTRTHAADQSMVGAAAAVSPKPPRAV